jgi:hypothetical protein
MILEVARLLTDWFNDPVQGVAARLNSTVTRDAGEPLPAIGTIADQTRNNLVAQTKYPTTPGIAVNVRQLPLLDGNTQNVSADGIADILVRVCRSEKDSKIAARDSSYILRAIAQSWRAFNLDTRIRNQIQVYACVELAVAPNFEVEENLIHTGAVAGKLRFRDIAVP